MLRAFKDVEAARKSARRKRDMAQSSGAVVVAPPIASIDDLRADFWPEDDLEEFEATIRRWRDADRRG
jgi:hypothetical protein